VVGTQFGSCNMADSMNFDGFLENGVLITLPTHVTLSVFRHIFPAGTARGAHVATW
jgi:hypothetical protein